MTLILTAQNADVTQTTRSYGGPRGATEELRRSYGGLRGALEDYEDAQVSEDAQVDTEEPLWGDAIILTTPRSHGAGDAFIEST